MNTFPNYSTTPDQRASATAGRAAAREKAQHAYAEYASAAVSRAKANEAAGLGSENLELDFDYWGPGSEALRETLYYKLRYNSPRRKTPGLTDRGAAERPDGLTLFPMDVSIGDGDDPRTDFTTLFELLGLRREAEGAVPPPEGFFLVKMSPGYYLDEEGLYIGDILIGHKRDRLDFGLCEKARLHIKVARLYLPRWLQNPIYIQGPTDGCDT